MESNKTYPGSCHCGQVQYQVRLKLPPTMKPGAVSVRIYKCNCSVCQKMGFFHCRPITPAEDFVLTAPATIEELGDYRVYTKKHGWYFCKNCGVRVFGVRGEWEQVELDVESWAGTKPDGEQEKLRKVWKVKPEAPAEASDKDEPKKPNYLSVNAVTFEPGHGVDLKKWHEDGWVFYVENLVNENGFTARLSEPYDGGMY